MKWIIILLIYSFSTASFTVKSFAQKSTDIQVFSDAEKRKFDYYFYEALNSKALGKYDEAIDYFLHCYSIDSTNANVLVELGTFYNALQEKDKALDFYRKAVNYDKTNYYYNMMLAGLSKELELNQEVVDIYEGLLELNPGKPELLFEIANAYADNGELEKAINQLDELEKSMGVSEALAINKFRLYSMLDNKEKAYEEIQQIIDKNPGDIRYLILMGDLYADDNQLDKAKGYYDQAKLIDPDYPALILSFVNYYEKTGSSDAAQTEIQKAITSSSMEVDTKIQLLTRYLSVLQQNKKDIKEANPLFQSLFEQHPNNTQLNLIYGNVLYLQGDKKGAIDQFQIFINGNPDNPAGYEQILRVALPEEDFDKVKEVTTEALKHLPGEPQFYFYLGAVNFQQGNYKEALKVFEVGLDSANFNNPILESDFYGQIGDINYHLENKEVAFDSYEKALKLNPQNLPVLNNYSYYLSLEKRNLDKAEQMSGITVKLEPLNPTYLDTYGWILYEQGSYIMAKIYIEKAIEYGEEPSAEVYEHYGDVLFMTGEQEKAVEQWKKARELGGDSRALKRKIRRGKL
ncbi:MAG: tetratricopeptide repeat protein [Fermentimonas sp.]|jgi:tetratricopeptide (TPR) repeat protein|nr:tetratricopeptide repeat protein [Fermentimonas sp.]MDD3188140.1 tetratricopeptide repeat protein [Fermentimonas sp.]MDD4284286.1 tetratricopeptide repeat protein [Fermentimonas sp.]MDD4724222.1 tetratricopeptide repeat protein [Fermentimonas sp.]